MTDTTRRETATETLARLQAEEMALKGREDELSRRLTEAEQTDRAELLVAGGSLRDPEAEQARVDLGRLREDRAAYRKAIARVAPLADRERVETGRATRDRLRPEWEKALARYDGALGEIRAALETIRALNKSLAEQRHGAFPALPFAGLSLERWPHEYEAWLSALRFAGVHLHPEPPKYVPPPVPPLAPKAAQRFRVTPLTPDLP